MANYVGYFRGSYWANGVNRDPVDALYTVRLIGDSGDTGYTEIALAGDSPFVVRYETPQTPFEPIIKSTATVTIVHNDYLDDILSPYAHGTKISVTREFENTETLVWEGFLSPKIYNQGYDDCFETIELEAVDCITSLQYFDYEVPDDGIPTIKRLDKIISQIANKCEVIDKYYWGETKRFANGTMIQPEHLALSEVNFYSSDTDKVWNLYEVLEEICRYLGFNVFYQPSGNTGCLWFIDKWVYNRGGNANAFYYVPNQGEFVFGGMTSFPHPMIFINEKNFAGSGADISFEPIYNKATVRDNFYFVDDWIPGLFDDQYLINRVDPCDRFAEYRINGETETDRKHQYYQRPFTHRYWKNTYRDSADNIVHLLPETLATPETVRDFRGATILDMGVIGIPDEDPTGGNIRWQYGFDYYIPKADYTRYLCISEKSGIAMFHRNEYQTDISGSTLIAITDFPSQVVPSQNAYLVINFDSIFEKYQNRAYINPEWNNDPPEGDHGYVYTHAAFPIILKIGNKYWDGYNGEWTTEPKYFITRYNRGYNTKKKDWDNQDPKPNRTESTLNSVPWSLGVDAEGYLIPLNGVDWMGTISVTFCTPTRQWKTTDKNNNVHYTSNAYCWLSDISFKIVEPMQDSENNDNDVIYENVIDEDAVNEYSEATFKITTATESTKPAYSNMAVISGGTWQPLNGFYDDSLADIQTAEANLVEKIVTQYSTSTKKINLTLKDNGQVHNLSTFKEMDIENPDDKYMPLGAEYDYGKGSISGTFIQIKE